MQISQIYIYPIKSLGGISVTEALVEARGLQYDRRWMLVDEKGQFYSQRSFPEMALLQVSFLPDGLVITHKFQNISSLTVGFQESTGNKITVTIWDDVCSAEEVSQAANIWFTHVLGKSCRLVLMPEDTRRSVDPDYGDPADIVSFADAYPLLLIGQESLNDLNAKLTQPILMNRFRPNLVFTGAPAFSEDFWDAFTIGDIPFRGVKLCSRCVLTTIDQATAQKGTEPLKTLASYRTIRNKVMFGQNIIPSMAGKTLKTGDIIQVQSVRENIYL